MIPPQPVPSENSARRRASKSIHLGYNTGEFDKNHLGDHTAALPTAHSFQEYWGYGFTLP
jgi:hypothetical protein